jgi:predicted lipoprotein with Yx(FWY)xxD motif
MPFVQPQQRNHFTPDAPTKLACSGGSAETWPPLLFTGSGTPTGSTSLTGKLSVLNGPMAPRWSTWLSALYLLRGYRSWSALVMR